MKEPWQERREIGDAVLYLGDCLEILPTLEPIDFVFTDPPYGHNNNDGDLISNREAALGQKEKAKKAKPRPIANDGKEATEITMAALTLASDLMSDDSCCCCCCCCGGGGPDPQFARWSLMLDDIMCFKHAVVWDKGPMGMGWHYRRSYEMVLVAQKKPGKARWYDTSNKVENVIRPGTFAPKILPSAKQHPTAKPPGLAEHFILLHSKPGDIVLDPFMGGGSTGVAALKSGRRFIGIEIDPEFYEMSCDAVSQAHSQPSLFEAV